MGVYGRVELRAAVVSPARRERLWRQSPDQRSPVEIDAGSPELWDAVRSLPAKQRTAVVLRYVGDYPEAEIAEAMGVTRGTVAATLSAARAALATKLGEDDFDEEGYYAEP